MSGCDLGVDAVHAGVAGTIFAGRVVVHAIVDSTIDACRTEADAGAAEGLVVLAEEQRGGRGQRGNRWHSPAGAGVFLSTLLRPPLKLDHLPSLTSLAGLAACEALREDIGAPVVLKRPNDLLLDVDGTWRKLGGLLVDTAVQGHSLRHAIVSLGVNVRPPAGGFPDELSAVATSLLDAGLQASRSDVASAFLRHLAALRKDLSHEPSAWLAVRLARHESLARDVRPGQPVVKPS